MSDRHDTMTVRAAAKALGVGRETVRRLLRVGRLGPRIVERGDYRIRRDAVERLLSEGMPT